MFAHSHFRSHFFVLSTVSPSYTTLLIINHSLFTDYYSTGKRRCLFSNHWPKPHFQNEANTDCILNPNFQPCAYLIKHSKDQPQMCAQKNTYSHWNRCNQRSYLNSDFLLYKKCQNVYKYLILHGLMFNYVVNRDHKMKFLGLCSVIVILQTIAVNNYWIFFIIILFKKHLN